MRSGASFTCVGPVVSPRCCTTFLRIIFGGLTNLLFRKFEFLTKLGLEGKKTVWGCRTEVVLKITFFPFFPGRGPICENFWRVFGAQLCRGLGLSRAVARNLVAAAVRMVFPSFLRLFYRHRFCEFEKGSFENVLLFSKE